MVRPAPNETAGSVLILALWTLFFITALALALHTRVLGMTRFAAQSTRERIAYAAAHGGVALAQAALVPTNGWDRLVDDPALFRDRGLPGGAHVSVSYVVRDSDGVAVQKHGLAGEEGKVNFNRASPELLHALLQRIGGIESRAATALATRILDWRGDGEEEAGRAAERRYRERGVPPGVRGHPMQTLHELLLIEGMSEDVFARIMPHATLYGEGRIHVNMAALPVLEALADSVGAGTAAERASLCRKLVQFREAGHAFDAVEEKALLGPLEDFISLSAGERSVLRALRPELGVESRFFGGHALGGAGLNPDEADADVTRRIRFILDRERRAPVYWEEG